MTSKTTFYFSRIIGSKIFDNHHKLIGTLVDVVANIQPSKQDESEPLRPRVEALCVKTSGKKIFIRFKDAFVFKPRKKYQLKVIDAYEIPESEIHDFILLGDIILDQQIVDINGRKVVRVNDIRLVSISEGIFAVAVDVGMEGLLRRIGIVKPFRILFELLHVRMPSRFILFDDVAALDYSNLSIRLSTSVSKLHKLHPSDLADIIEELGKASKTSVFSVLDEEKAADVLEELEPEEQVHIIESLSVEKAADVLEKMPANEAADIIDVLEEDKAELLLNEMETESSEEVRELLEYSDKKVGSLMTTDVLSFNENITVEDVLQEIRTLKPEMEMLYNLFVTDRNEKLIATLSLRDVVISSPETAITEVMKRNPICVYDEDKIDSLAEIISKYNLLAIPVLDKDDKLEGMVVIDDVVEDLINKRRTI